METYSTRNCYLFLISSRFLKSKHHRFENRKDENSSQKCIRNKRKETTRNN